MKRSAARVLIVGILAIGLAAPAIAQSFNIDADARGAPPELGGGVPDSSFAAVGLAGTWNSWSAAGQAPMRLTGLDGSLSNVIFEGPHGGSGNGFFNPNNTGSHAALLNDGRSFSENTWTFSGLMDGFYRLVTYAASPSNNITNTSVFVTGASIENQFVTGPMPGNAFVLGDTHVIHEVDVTGGLLSVTITEGRDPAYLNGFQLIHVVPEPTTAVAFVVACASLLIRRARSRK